MSSPKRLSICFCSLVFSASLSAQVSNRDMLTGLTPFLTSSVSSACVKDMPTNATAIGKKVSDLTIKAISPSKNSTWFSVAFTTNSSFDFAYVNPMARSANGLPRFVVVCDYETWASNPDYAQIKFTKSSYRPGYWTDLDDVLREMR